MEPIFKSVFIVFSLLIASTHVNSRHAGNSLQNHGQRKQNAARIQFYLHDILAGPNSTVLEVARAQITSRSPTRFGTVMAEDDLVTAGADLNSQILGRAQGLITFADLHVSALAMYLNIVFTAGQYNGSSFSILGRNEVMTRDRELPIVGGTGLFRMARGYCISNTHSYDSAANHAILEFTAYISYV